MGRPKKQPRAWVELLFGSGLPNVSGYEPGMSMRLTPEEDIVRQRYKATCDAWSEAEDAGFEDLQDTVLGPKP